MAFHHPCDIWDSLSFISHFFPEVFRHEKLMLSVAPEGQVGVFFSELLTIFCLGLFWYDACCCNCTVCLLTYQVHRGNCFSDLSLFLISRHKFLKKSIYTNTKQKNTTKNHRQIIRVEILECEKHAK